MVIKTTLMKIFLPLILRQFYLIPTGEYYFDVKQNPVTAIVLVMTLFFLKILFQLVQAMLVMLLSSLVQENKSIAAPVSCVQRRSSPSAAVRYPPKYIRAARVKAFKFWD